MNDYMKARQIRHTLSIAGLIGFETKSKHILSAMNKVRIHQKEGETWEHWLIKCGLAKAIMMKGDVSLSEFPVKSRIIDEIQVTKNNTLIAYEPESKKGKRKPGIKGIDIIEVPLYKMPSKVKEAINIIRKWCENIVI